MGPKTTRYFLGRWSRGSPSHISNPGPPISFLSSCGSVLYIIFQCLPRSCRSWQPFWEAWAPDCSRCPPASAWGAAGQWSWGCCRTCWWWTPCSPWSCRPPPPGRAAPCSPESPSSGRRLAGARSPWGSRLCRAGWCRLPGTEAAHLRTTRTGRLC